MIDPITLIATAKATIEGVRKAIELGHDAADMIHEFFDAKDAIMKERSSPTKKPLFQSANSEAMEIIQVAEEMKQVEEEIKISFMRRGKTHLWMQFLQERNRIVSERKSDEIADDKKKAKRKKEIDEAITMVLAGILLATILTLVAWGTIELTQGKT